MAFWNLAKFSKCLFMSVASTMSTMDLRKGLYSDWGKFSNMLMFESPTVNWNARAAWWFSSTDLNRSIGWLGKIDNFEKFSISTYTSLYNNANGCFVLIKKADPLPGWSTSWITDAINAATASVCSTAF